MVFLYGVYIPAAESRYGHIVIYWRRHVDACLEHFSIMLYTVIWYYNAFRARFYQDVLSVFRFVWKTPVYPDTHWSAFDLKEFTLPIREWDLYSIYRFSKYDIFAPNDWR